MIFFYKCREITSLMTRLQQSQDELKTIIIKGLEEARSKL
ncbi:hypothetical protein LSO10F_270006 [Candidatus Liberibacter solanacearum]